MYTALYRAYRPEVFEQLLGQEHIIRILKNQIASGTTSHAYLFCGTRGTGKTTTARLLAKGLNCLSEGERPCGECEACQAIKNGSFLDVVEIDAASNRGIDDIRQLRDSVNYPPASGRNKVYIIDEVHMLSTEAFNALLKTLEEPPEYVTFILATTEPRKLPATILSRCLRLDFKRIPETVLIEGMKRICGEIGIDVTDAALRIIAANADGSVRDGLSILDQCISGGDRTVDAPQVLDFLGASGETVFVELTDLVSKRRTAEAIEYLAEVLADGKDVRQLIRDWISHYRNLMMTKFIRDPRAVINLSVENIDRIREQSSVMELEDINRGIMELSKTADVARWSSQPRILLEVCIVRLCQGGGALPPRGAERQVSRPLPKAGPAAEKPIPPDVTPAEKESVDAAPAEEVSADAPGPDPDDAGASLDSLDALIAAAGNREEENSVPAQPLQKPAETEARPEPPARRQAPENDDLVVLWDEVFTDGEHAKGSIYLIRSNSMLTHMDENTFTVTVRNDMTRKQTERSRSLLEDLMEARTGKHRIMRVVTDESGSGEISVEEAAARASDVLGIEVGIE
ncbi:MAG: DNA polymerase III subunit gamma/tau [Firmicutes bacterium]|nr:DNA polymerase III subunit gamma/tau [Bacillota bacterium]